MQNTNVCDASSVTTSMAKAILHQPTYALIPSFCSHSKCLKLKPISFPLLTASKTDFLGGFVLRKADLGNSRSLDWKSMTESIITCAFRDGDRDRGVTTFEQETLINGSSELATEGWESTLNRLSKWLVAVIFGAVILWRHDAEAMWAAMGSVVNATLSVVLKRILNQERPFSTSRSDPGMPSSHSQSIFFIVIFTVISIVEWLGINEYTLIISACAFVFGSYLSWLRVAGRLHTVSQVVVGAAVGSIFSILWFWSWTAIVLNAYTSFLWVRILVISGAASFSLGFLLYVIRYWLRIERL